MNTGGKEGRGKKSKSGYLESHTSGKEKERRKMEAEQ